MATVPQTYYQFIMDYAPYVYVIPPDTPDAEWGKAAKTEPTPKLWVISR